MSEIDPITREETYLNAISEGSESGLSTITREEMYLSAIAGESDLPADMTPITRREIYLQKIYDNGGAGGGGEAEGTVQINITQNGTITRNVARYASAEITTNVPNSYEASDEGKVVSNGALASQTSRNVTANGTYDTTVNDEVVVNVPNPSTGTKQITTNGTHDVADYASAQVNVPNSYSASDEGKVVSNGALVAQTSRTVTSNGTVDTTLNDEVVVNVPTGITPSGSQTFTENGTYDVTNLAQAVVNVASGSSEDTFIEYLKGTLEKDIVSDEVTEVPSYACHRWGGGITGIRFPNCTSVGNSAFYMVNITKAFVPNATLQASCFYGTQLASCVSKGALNNGAGDCFRSYGGNNHYLTTVDLTAKSAGITGRMFDGQTAFTSLILRESAIYPLTNTNAFTLTPFASGGTGGTIYIPKSLYDHLGDGSALDYKSATNWSTIEGYGTITWAQIEGSAYENAYADGTPIE